MVMSGNVLAHMSGGGGENFENFLINFPPISNFIFLKNSHVIGESDFFNKINFTQSLMNCLPHAKAQDCVNTCPSSLLYPHHHKSKLLPVVIVMPLSLQSTSLV